MSNKERSVFSVIADDEFRTLSTDIVESRVIKNDTVEWQDDWKQNPDDTMKHQFRKNVKSKKSKKENEIND